MPFKLFGRLAGKTQAADALESTSEPNATTRYDPAAAGSKMIAYGEDGLSLAMNRALGALSANSDYLYTLLGSPACRTDILTPERTEGGNDYGFAALTGVDVGATAIDLGVGARRPVQWVYLGLHKDRIGDYVKLYRRQSTSLADGDYGLAADADEITPTDAKVNSNGATASFFGTQVYTGSSEHANADTIPPIARLQPDLPPYNQSTVNAAISSWDNDGFYITVYSSEELYLRPGCFVEIYNETSPTSNNGLWRVEAIRRADKSDPNGDKIVLGRGGLHRVSVDSVAAFAAGERVWWRSRPDDQAASTADQRAHSAHIAFIDTNGGRQDLYLADFSSGEDMPIQGGTQAFKVNDDAAAYQGLKAHNQVGMIDREEDANQNWSLTVGTLLYDESGASFTDVIDVIGSGYPVRFDTTSSTGNFYVCNPLGWALNPTLVFAADSVIGGDYYGNCFTLTTVREQLTSQGAAANKGTLENPFTYGGMSRGTIHALRNALKYMKVGSGTIATTNDMYGPFTGGRYVLGEARWAVTVQNNTNPGTTIAAQVTPGDAISIAYASSATVSSANTRAVVVSAEAADPGRLILKDVSWKDWDDQEDFLTAAPITGNAVLANASTFTAGGDTFQVTSVDQQPTLSGDVAFDGTGAGGAIPDFGLNAAYNAHTSADPYERGASGNGSRILLVGNQPVKLVQPVAGAGPFRALQVLDDRTDSELIGLASKAGIDTAVIKKKSNSLSFYDSNTLADIDFSSAAYTALPTGTSSILEALGKAYLGSASYTGPWSTGLLGGAAISNVGLSVSAAAGLFVRQGVAIPGAAAASFDTLPADGTRYVAFTPSTATYSLESTIDPTDNDKVYLHKYVTVASAVTAETDIRDYIRRVDKRVDLLVGSPAAGDSYSEEIGHFVTLSSAIEYIDIVTNDSAASFVPAWRIKLIGNTAEASGSLPISIPVDGLTIEGSPHENYTLEWGVDNADYKGALFDMNGKNGLTFRDLHINYNDTAATVDTTLRRIVFSEPGGAYGVSDWTFDNVTITATQTSRLHACLYVTNLSAAAANRIRVMNCNWSGASEVAVYIYEANNVWVKDSVFTGTPAQQTAGGDGAIILVGDSGPSQHCWVCDNEIDGWDKYGVGIFVLAKSYVRGNTISNVDLGGTGTDAYGIYVDSNSSRVCVDGNITVGIGPSVVDPNPNYGLWIDAEKCKVSNNDARVSTVGGTTNFAGIRLAANSNYCSVVGNQTNNFNLIIDNAGTNSTAANRDDL